MSFKSGVKNRVTGRWWDWRHGLWF